MQPQPPLMQSQPPQLPAMEQRCASKRPYNLHIDLPKRPTFLSSSAPANPAANFAHHELEILANGLKFPSSDPIFFTDPRLRIDIANAWGVPTGRANIAIHNNGAHPHLNSTADYRCPAMPMPRYDPAADDLQIFCEYEQRAAEAEKSKTKSPSGLIPETARGHRIAGLTYLRHKYAERPAE